MADTKISKDALTSEVPCPIEAIQDEVSKCEAVFTLQISETLSVERLEGVKGVLEDEVKRMEEAHQERYERADDEMAQALDLLTWLEFKIGSPQKALELNEKALALPIKHVFFSLGNRAHLMWWKFDVDNTWACLKRLTQLKQETTERNQLAITRAHQAYCYLRLGGQGHLTKSLDLYKEALKSKPDAFLWRLQMGRVYKRLSHPNLLKKGERLDLELKTEREKQAINCFCFVAKNAPSSKHKAFAYSDLASMTCTSKCFGVSRESMTSALCRKALSLNCDYPYVLLNCAKSIKGSDTSFALKLLIDASKLGPTSQIFFQLGSCYESMSREAKISKDKVRYYRDAEKAYGEAISLAPFNMPARYSRAKCLLHHGNVKEAKAEFMGILVRAARGKSYAQTLMKAYEQAAMCHLKLPPNHDYVGKMPHADSTYDKESSFAEGLLIQALQIGFDLLNQKQFKRYLGKSKDLLLNLSTRQKNVPEALLLISRVYRLAKEPNRSLKALESLLQYDSNDPNVVIYAIKNYLHYERYERALTLLYFVKGSFGLSRIDGNLFKEVSLFASRDRLRESNIQAVRIFKTHFDHYRQQRCFFKTEQSEETGLSSPVSTSYSGDELAGDESLDVLIFYDDSGDGSSGLSNLTHICRKLEQSMIRVLGLNVSDNLQNSGSCREKTNLQLEEMKKAEVVLVLLGPDPADQYFTSFLEYLPRIALSDEKNPTPPRVLVAPTEDGVKIPSALSVFSTVPKIKPTLASFDAFLERCGGKDNDPCSAASEPVSQHGSRFVEDIMAFFCCLIDTDWPFENAGKENKRE